MNNFSRSYEYHIILMLFRTSGCKHGVLMNNNEFSDTRVNEEIQLLTAPD